MLSGPSTSRPQGATTTLYDLAWDLLYEITQSYNSKIKTMTWGPVISTFVEWEQRLQIGALSQTCL